MYRYCAYCSSCFFILKQISLSKEISKITKKQSGAGWCSLCRIYTWYIIHVVRKHVVSTCIRIQVARLGYLYPATCRSIWCKRGFRPTDQSLSMFLADRKHANTRNFDKLIQLPAYCRRYTVVHVCRIGLSYIRRPLHVIPFNCTPAISGAL